MHFNIKHSKALITFNCRAFILLLLTQMNKIACFEKKLRNKRLFNNFSSNTNIKILKTLLDILIQPFYLKPTNLFMFEISPKINTIQLFDSYLVLIESSSTRYWILLINFSILQGFVCSVHHSIGLWPFLNKATLTLARQKNQNTATHSFSFSFFVSFCFG